MTKKQSELSILRLILLGLVVYLVVLIFSAASSSNSDLETSFSIGNYLFPNLPFQQNIDVASIFSGTLIIVALIERTTELFISFITNDLNKATNDDEKNTLIKDRRNTALVVGLVAGFIASIIGIRILSSLVDINSVDSPQKEIVVSVDIVFSAIGISLGSQLFHIFPSLTSSILGAAKEQADANMESSKLRKADLKSERMSIEIKNQESEREIATIEREIANSRLEKLETEREALRIEQEMKSKNPTTSSSSEVLIKAEGPE